MARLISSSHVSTKTIFACILIRTARATIFSFDLTDLVGSVELTGTAWNLGLPLFDAILGYGCWCYLDPKDDYRSNARGKPMDLIDKHCKTLINGYKCALIDSENSEEDECDAQTILNVPFSFGELDSSGNIKWMIEDPLEHRDQTLPYGLEDECYKKNNLFLGAVRDSCSQKACMIEGLFMEFFFRTTNLLPLKNNPNYSYFNQSLVHVNRGGTFDPEQHCHRTPSQNIVQSKKECCGPHTELRHPYRVGSGVASRICCHNTVINNLIQDCCNHLPVEFGSSCVANPPMSCASPTLINPPESARTVTSNYFGYDNSMLDSAPGWLSKHSPSELAALTDLKNEYLLMDLGSDLPIGGIALQGHGDAFQQALLENFYPDTGFMGVTKFRVEYWKDGEVDFASNVASKIDYYKAQTSAGFEFTGYADAWYLNADGSGFNAMWTRGQQFELFFGQGVVGRYFKIIPVEYRGYSPGFVHISMRAGVYQCDLIDD